MEPAGCASFRPTRTRMRKPSRLQSRPMPSSAPRASTWLGSPRSLRRLCRPAHPAKCIPGRVRIRVSPASTWPSIWAPGRDASPRWPSTSTGRRPPPQPRWQAPWLPVCAELCCWPWEPWVCLPWFCWRGTIGDWAIDRKGALRIGIARCLLGLLAWIGTVHPVPDESMIPFFFANCAAWLMWGATLALLYVALEPLVHARWPHSIVTWNRLLAGRWLDAQVGSHILIGATVGAAVWLAAQGFGDWQNPGMDTLGGINSALGTRQWLAAHAIVMEGSLFFGLLVFFSICGLRQMVRKDVPAAILAALLLVLSSGSVFTSPNWKLEAAISISVYSVLVLVLLRLGLVATMAAVFFIDSFNLISLGADWKTWYAPAGLATFFLLLGIAIFAFWRSLGSRELFSAAVNP